MGSLAQYPGVFDVIENLYIYNNTLSNATDSARIKIWAGEHAVTKPGWIGGGGTGHVLNVTYDGFHVKGNDAVLKIDQCYGTVNASTCEENPSQMIIEDVVFKNFWGTTSKKGDPVVGSLICSDDQVSSSSRQASSLFISSPRLTISQSCRNVRAENVNVSTPSGKTPQWQVRFIDTELLDVVGDIVDG